MPCAPAQHKGLALATVGNPIGTAIGWWGGGTTPGYMAVVRDIGY